MISILMQIKRGILKRKTNSRLIVIKRIFTHDKRKVLNVGTALLVSQSNRHNPSNTTRVQNHKLPVF